LLHGRTEFEIRINSPIFIRALRSYTARQRAGESAPAERAALSESRVALLLLVGSRFSVGDYWNVCMYYCCSCASVSVRLHVGQTHTRTHTPVCRR